MNSNFANADRYWLAYRYVADEMSDTERTAFEETLDADQAAREAVARIVSLSASVRALSAEAFVQRGRRSEVFARVGWMSLGVAASLLMMISWQAWSIDPRDNSARQNPQVVLAWTPAAQDATEADESNDEAEDTSEYLETPSWLMAALAPQEAAPAPAATEIN